MGTCHVDALQDTAGIQLSSGCNERIFSINSIRHHIIPDSVFSCLLSVDQHWTSTFWLLNEQPWAVLKQDDPLDQVSWQADAKPAISSDNFICWLPPTPRSPKKMTNWRPTNPLTELSLQADVTKHTRGKEWHSGYTEVHEAFCYQLLSFSPLAHTDKGRS